MTFYNTTIEIHSVFRWIILFLLIYTILNALFKWKINKGLTPSDKKINTVLVVITHIQFILGISLYLVSPKVKFDSYTFSNSIIRFFTVEHSLLMIIAIIILTIGNIKSKKISDTVKSSRVLFTWFLISFIIIIITIPWPFLNLGSGWL